MTFTDDDLQQLKSDINIGNCDFTEILLPRHMVALIARLEAAEVGK